MQSFEGTRAVFVVGSPRSGTSALAWGLAQHPELATGPEMDFPYWIARLVEAQEPAAARPVEKLAPIEHAYQIAARREDGWLATRGVDRAQFLAALGSGLDAMLSVHVGGKRWIDSTPAAAMTCPQLSALFPRAQFIHILRDGRAAVSSMIHSGFDVRIAKDFKFACQTWATFAERAHAFAEAHPERCLEILQAELARDPQPVIDRVLEFLGCAPHPAVVEQLQRGRINSSWGNREKGDVRTSKDPSVIPSAPWRDWSAGQKRTFRRTAGAAMQALGFELELD